jgi:Fur family transcriptional regulator, ferric uptake regulator
MTVAHTHPPVPVQSLDDALAVLRTAGMRVSAARRLVLEALFATDEPGSAEQIAAGLGGRVPPSDLASVYRNLETLGDLGLVRHFHVGHGPGLYVLTGAEREYLVCDRCHVLKAVEPGDMDDLRTLIRDRLGWEASFTHFPMVGLCPDCAP